MPTLNIDKASFLPEFIPFGREYENICAKYLLLLQ